MDAVPNSSCTLFLEFARAALSAGFSVVPAIRHGTSKRPDLPAWSMYQTRLPSIHEISEWFGTPRNSVALICGAVSGNLEMIDFDCQGQAFDGWKAIVELDAPGLVDRLVIESTPSGGFHVVYRCVDPVEGSQRLALRRVEASSSEPVTIGGKAHTPRQDPVSGQWHAESVLIETRGEGGLFLCAPSPGYLVTQGDPLSPPTITADERETLLSAARQLDEAPPVIISAPSGFKQEPHGSLRPGDDYNQRGDVRAVLINHGWTLVREGENAHWRRPGKASGTSATLSDGVFYVFSSNAPPFEPTTGYSPFAVYTHLEHGGDWSAAARALSTDGYGSTSAHSNEIVTPFPIPQSSATSEVSFPPVLTAAQLLNAHSEPRQVVVSNLLRAGETMNIVASPKSWKSWLVLDLALAVSTGRPWLGTFETSRGNVLIIDNELHPETLASRLPMVAKERGILQSEFGNTLSIMSTRGALQDINEMENFFNQIEPGEYSMIVLDSMYRFMPEGTDENNNSSMARVYNQLDKYADRLRCSFVIIHHTTKGSQSERSITDVGAGAGAQSRAADTHLVLRPHKVDGVISLEAVTRSFESVKPICVRPGVPTWELVPGLDPTQLKSTSKRSSTSKGASGAPSASKEPKPSMTPRRFAEQFVSEEPRTRKEIREKAKAEKVTWRETDSLLNQCVDQELVACSAHGSSHKEMFSRRSRSSAEGVDA